jgi:Sulfotransferase family
MPEFTPSRFDFQPVIIIGAARSGTNMLREALARFDGVATWPCDEINAIWRYRNFAFPTDELPAHAASADVEQYIRAAFRRLAYGAGARCVVEKTCANSLRVDFVRAALPESKFIFLVRDGRDVVASAMKRWRAGFDLGYTLRKARFVPLPDVPRYAVRFARLRFERLRSREHRLPSWGPRFDGIDEWVATRSLAEVCAKQWSECVLKAAESFARLPPSAWCALRYEDLVAGPAQELARLSTFLDIPMSGGKLSGIAECISYRSVAKWRTNSCADAIASVEPLMDATWQQLNSIFPDWAWSAELAA